MFCSPEGVRERSPCEMRLASSAFQAFGLEVCLEAEGADGQVLGRKGVALFRVS